MLWKDSVSLCWPQRSSHLPGILLPVLFARLMLVKEPVSLCCPQLCCAALLPFAWLKLLKGSVPFVCPQRSSQLRSQLPSFLRKTTSPLLVLL